jgi:hypothetical protein
MSKIDSLVADIDAAAVDYMERRALSGAPHANAEVRRLAADPLAVPPRGAAAPALGA